MLILLATFGYAADCTAPVSASQVTTQVDDALLTWATMDEEGFKEGLDQLEMLLPCLDEPLKPAQAAAVHRVMGLRAFIDGDADSATLAFRSAAVAEPGYKLSERLAPKGGKLWSLYSDASSERAPSTESIPLPKGYRSWIDGAVTDRRANEIPSIIQVGPTGSKSNEIAWTGLMAPGESIRLPELEVNSGSDDMADLDLDLDGPVKGSNKPAKTPKRPGSGVKNGALWGAAAGTGAAAAGLFAVSAATRSSFESSPTKGKYNTVNGTFLGSVGLTTVAGALVVAALAK